MQSVNAGRDGIDSGATRESTDGDDPLRNSQHSKASGEAANSPRRILRAVSPSAHPVPTTVPVQPWQRTYKTAQAAIAALEEWRLTIAPGERPQEFQVARVPNFPDVYMLAPIFRGDQLALTVTEAALLEYEEMKKKRQVRAGITSYLVSCLE